MADAAQRGLASGPTRRRLIIGGWLLLALALAIGPFLWYQLFREVSQPAWVTGDDEQNFLYGSIGSEEQAGIPYWIVVVLPRIFGDYTPGPGGYAAFGLPWEEGRELPVGFSKKTVGFDRVAFTCAVCHTAQYRLNEHDTPHIVAGAGAHTANVQALLEFLGRAAADPRFNSTTILREIDLAYPLTPAQRFLYKYVLIPLTKRELMKQAGEFAWASSRPAWGPGRDAPMNLTKFSFLHMPQDDTVDNTKFPSIWNLNARIQKGRTWPEDDYSLTADFSKASIDPAHMMLMNLAGDTTSFRSVLIDSALGLRAKNTPFFRRRMDDLERWLRSLRPPKYPLAESEAERAALARGGQVFEQNCASCHAPGRDNRLGTVIPLAEIGTDPSRVNAWTRAAADAANAAVARLGVHRTPMAKPPVAGYVAVALDGIWLRAPYLHNASVPTLRALLEPGTCRPRRFYAGYDVIDGDNVGYVSTRCGEPPAPKDESCSAIPVQSGCMPAQKGWSYDTAQRGNSNAGHEYGTTLSEADKSALLAFLRTL